MMNVFSKKNSDGVERLEIQSLYIKKALWITPKGFLFVFGSLLGFLAGFDLVFEFFAGFEFRDVVCGNHDGGVLGDIATGFLGAAHNLESTKTTEIYVLTVGHGVLDGGHHLLNNVEGCGFVDTSFLVNLRYDFCFCHDYIV